MLLVSVCILFRSGPAQARWAKPEDMDAEIEESDLEILVHRNGTYEELMDETDLILKDSARISRGMVRITYNPELTHLEVIKAETINLIEGREVRTEVSPQMIEDKPLASSGEGFDQWHQALIAFPDVDVGSKIHLKYKLNWYKVTSPDFYSNSFGFGGDYQKKGKVTVRSEVPLFIEINNPENSLKVSKSEVKSDPYPYRLSLQLNHPVLKSVVDEADPFLHPKLYPFVDVATSESWSDVSKSVLKDYEDIINASLPASFEKIAKKVRSISDPVEKMNTLTSLLADNIRYLGDWRTIKGKWVPRTLQTIAKSKFGDCKDFAAVISAILRHIGIRAQVAWVWRGWAPVVANYHLPSNFRFNHAISRAQVDGKSYWLDGTNVASFAQGVLGDISDRPALVLGEHDSRIERVSAPRPEDFSYILEQQFDFDKPDRVEVQGSFQSRGGDAASWINGNFNLSRESLDYKLIRAAARTDNFIHWKVEGFNIKTRSVNDLKARFKYTDLAVGYRSTAGLIYPILFPDAVERLLFSSDHRESDVLLGETFVYERNMRLKNINIVGSESMSCSFDSPWISVSRESSKTPDGLSIRDNLKLKVNRIASDEYKTPAFLLLQKNLTHCFLHAGVIHKADGEGHL